MRITWTFILRRRRAQAGRPNSADFRTLAGPDTDGDGVADASDACPSAKGTLSQRLPADARRPIPTRTASTARRTSARRPTAPGAANGCPGGVVPAPAPSGQPPGDRCPPAAPAALAGALGAEARRAAQAAGLGKGLDRSS